jgi:drug/metabolite transporter (DMT)-like permease
MGGVAMYSSERYGTLLIWSGVAVALVGAMPAIRSGNLQGEYNLKFDQKIPQLNYDRTDGKLREMGKSYDFGVLMAAAGAILIAVGFIMNKIISGEI